MYLDSGEQKNLYLMSPREMTVSLNGRLHYWEFLEPRILPGCYQGKNFQVLAVMTNVYGGRYIGLCSDIGKLRVLQNPWGI